MTTDIRHDPYPSRVGDDTAVAVRRDPVRWGETEGPLDRSRLDAYTRDGFVILPDVLDDRLLDACDHAIEDLRRDGGADVAEPDDDAALRSLFLLDRHPAFAALTGHPTLLGIARQLLGSDVYLHQSRINLKRAFVGRGFPWHSDFETWHVEDGMPAMRAVSCSVALSDNGPHNGPLLLIAGSHRSFVSCPGRTPEDNHLDSLRRQEYGVPDPETLRLLADAGRTETFTGGRGSVVFFDCNTMHGSGENISPYDRTNAFFVYNSVENGLVDPFGTDRPRPVHLAAREFTPVEPHRDPIASAKDAS